MLITDRVLDLQTMVGHSWTYAAMMHDLLGLKHNRVTVKSSDKGSQSFVIDVNDFFWLKNAALPFPTVAGKYKNISINLIICR